MQSDNYPAYFRYWGKTRKSDNDEGDAYHLLPYHCLDVAAVAAYWWDNSTSLRHAFCTTQQYSEVQIRAWVLFFIALHDLGKFDIRFQCKAVDVWLNLHSEDQYVELPTQHSSRTFDHGGAGLFWFIDDYQSAKNDEVFSFPEPHPYQSWMPWVEAVMGHHGYVTRQTQVVGGAFDMPFSYRRFSLQDKVARQTWIDMLEVIFLNPVGLSVNDQPPTVSPLLAGFCSISDWLGSWLNVDTFNYCMSYPKESDGLQQYFETKLNHDAALAVQRSGLLASLKPYSGVDALLDKGYNPRQLQVLVDDLPMESGLTLIEAPTGSGKTETALAYAWSLLEHNLADSIIFALPTQATANAMLKRMEILATKLFDHPNLILAHGNNRFNEDFKAIKQNGVTPPQEGEAWVTCCEWISQSRKKVFLGQVGVCTIDQVLVSVLPLSHRFIRGFGVGRSVLIVDEVHAYDSYMTGLLDAVLIEQAAAGRSAILLSATLPKKQKQRLLASYGTSMFAKVAGNETEAYPLISWSGFKSSKTFDLQNNPEQLPPDFALYIESHHLQDLMPDAILLDRMINAAQSGAQVCFICNVVADAQKVYQQLTDIAESNIDIMIFHARFTLNDRKEKEQGILNCFGKNGDRSRGRILVSTQVVEQSLDVDFDWLITQLCPIDLLFQRLGRLHRHQRDNRPEHFVKPSATVLLPNADNYGVHGQIYSNTRVMWRTQKIIEALDTQPLHFPEAYRRWIEPVYSEEFIDSEEPEWIDKGMIEFEKQEIGRRSSVNLMLDWAKNPKPLSDDDKHVRAVTRDGEMSLPVVPYRLTTQGRQLLDGQLYDELDEFQQQEALALNRVNVPHGWKWKLNQELNDEIMWLPGNYVGDGMQLSGKGMTLFYSKEKGMEEQNEFTH